MDFLLVLIELFLLDVTAEELRANIRWKSAISLQRGPVDLKFQVEGVAPTNHSSSQKTVERARSVERAGIIRPIAKSTMNEMLL